MNKRQKKKKSKEYIKIQKNYFKKQGIKLKEKDTNSPRYTPKPMVVYQSLEQLAK